MKCGDKGHVTVFGRPCDQNIGAEATGCLWHADHVTAAGRTVIATRGALAAMRSLPPDAPVPSFNSREEIVSYAEEHARLVAIGLLDPRLSAEMRGWADLAMRAHELSALDRLAKLERRVVGGKRVV